MTGIEICRRVLPQIDPAGLSGTVVCVPLANVLAHMTRACGFLHEERWLSKGKATLSAEMGESRRVTAEYVPIGVRGIHNVLRTLGMESGEPEPPGDQRVFRTILLAHCGHGGGLRQLKVIGDEVRKGDPIAEIVDVFGETVEWGASPASGFVLRSMRFGSVSTGSEVAWIAS